MSGSDESAPRPTVTLKIATSLDGRIATATGESKWITGEAAREEVHRLRAVHNAVLVGSQTVLDDDPELTVRLPGYEGPQPLRVVADARGRVPRTARLFSPSVSTRLLIVRSDGASNFHLPVSTEPGVIMRGGVSNELGVFPGEESLSPASEGVAPQRILACIERNLRLGSASASASAAASPRILLEGGGKLAASFLRENLIDRIEWFRAPIVLGGDAKPAVAALELSKLAQAPRFKRVDVKEVGDDLWERYERAE
jgi:diaminohydroxyphosphoribosylaminopyrimidine deaminase/5-amino-6-(5-phosphoribosylamino)uracil reductase